MWDHGGQCQVLIMHLVLGSRCTGTSVGIIPHGVGFRFPHRIQRHIGIRGIGRTSRILRWGRSRCGCPAKEVVSRAGRSRRAQSQGYILGLGLRRRCTAAAIGIVGDSVGGRLIRNGNISGTCYCNLIAFIIRIIIINNMILYLAASDTLIVPVTVKYIYPVPFGVYLIKNDRMPPAKPYNISLLQLSLLNYFRYALFIVGGYRTQGADYILIAGCWVDIPHSIARKSKARISQISCPTAWIILFYQVWSASRLVVHIVQQPVLCAYRRNIAIWFPTWRRAIFRSMVAQIARFWSIARGKEFTICRHLL